MYTTVCKSLTCSSRCCCLQPEQTTNLKITNTNECEWSVCSSCCQSAKQNPQQLKRKKGPPSNNSLKTPKGDNPVQRSLTCTVPLPGNSSVCPKQPTTVTTSGTSREDKLKNMLDDLSSRPLNQTSEEDTRQPTSSILSSCGPAISAWSNAQRRKASRNIAKAKVILTHARLLNEVTKCLQIISPSVFLQSIARHSMEKLDPNLWN